MKSPWSSPRPDPDEIKRVKPAACPWCGSINDGASDVDGKIIAPTPGDIVICFYCVGLAQYSADGALVKLSDVDEVIVRADPKIERIVRGLQAFRASKA